MTAKFVGALIDGASSIFPIGGPKFVVLTVFNVFKTNINQLLKLKNVKINYY